MFVMRRRFRRSFRSRRTIGRRLSRRRRRITRRRSFVPRLGRRM